MLSDVSVSWDLGKDWTVHQVPSSLPPIFIGDRLIVFGLLTPPHRDSAGEAGEELHFQARLQGSLGQKRAVIDHVIRFSAVSAKDHDQSLHGALHRLYAKCLIQEKQDEYHECYDDPWSDDEGDGDGEVDTIRDSVISVSKAANVVSKFTSFVAIDKDSHQPVSRPLKNPMLCYAYESSYDGHEFSSDDSRYGFLMTDVTRYYMGSGIKGFPGNHNSGIWDHKRIPCLPPVNSDKFSLVEWVLPRKKSVV